MGFFPKVDELVDDLPSSRLSFHAYQRQATTTAVYPGQGTFQGLAYAALGLSGEAGETVEQVKKTWRDDGTADIEAAMQTVLDHVRGGMRTGRIPYETVVDTAREEVHEAFRKPITEERRQKILKELGDVFWYAAQLCTELDADMGEVATANLDKLAERKAKNVIHGEGSDR